MTTTPSTHGTAPAPTAPPVIPRGLAVDLLAQAATRHRDTSEGLARAYWRARIAGLDEGDAIRVTDLSRAELALLLDRYATRPASPAPASKGDRV